MANRLGSLSLEELETLRQDNEPELARLPSSAGDGFDAAPALRESVRREQEIIREAIAERMESQAAAKTKPSVN